MKRSMWCLILKKIVCIVLPLHTVEVGCVGVMWTWSVDVSAFCEGIEGVGEC